MTEGIDTRPGHPGYCTMQIKNVVVGIFASAVSRSISTACLAMMAASFCRLTSGDVVISEIFYNLNGSESAATEWIEITNIGEAPIDLSGWTYEDIQDGSSTSPFPIGTTLGSGASAVVVDQSAATFQSIWGSGFDIISIGPGNGLSNGASSTNEIVAIRDSFGTIVDEVNYENGSNGSDWPANPNGASIYLLPGAFADTFANNRGSSWETSSIGVSGAYEALLVNPGIANATATDIASPGFARQILFDSPIINVPPDILPDNTVVPSNTTLNVSDGGVVGSSVQFGEADGSSQSVVVNVSGGTVGGGGRINAGTTVNMTGGFVDNFLGVLDEGILNIQGGQIGERLTILPGASVDVSGGILGNQVRVDGGTVVFRGGSQGDGFDIDSDASITVRGGEFFSGNSPISEFNESTFRGPLNGVYQDGTPFVMEIGPFSETILEVVSLPAIGPASIDASTTEAPYGIRAGQTLTVPVGGVAPPNFTAGRGSSLIVSGGVTGENVEAIDATVTMTSGQIGQLFDAYLNSVVVVEGGTAGSLGVNNTSSIEVLGGEIGFLFVRDEATATIAGGSVAFFSPNGGFSTISGGAVTMNGTSGTVALTGGTLGGSMTAVQLTVDGGDVTDGFGVFNPNGSIQLTSGTIGDSLILASGSLRLEVGTSIGASARLSSGASLVIAGGTIGSDLSLSDSSISIAGGQVGPGLSSTNSFLEILAGSVEGTITISETSELPENRAAIVIAGGEVGALRIEGLDRSLFLPALPPIIATAEVLGGRVLGDIEAGIWSEVNLRGGKLDGNLIAEADSEVSLHGAGFAIDGVPLEGLDDSAATIVLQRDAILTGVLSDGTPFTIDLASTPGDGGFVSPAAVLTVTQAIDFLAGDYNTDGVVDAADYTVWRDALGEAAGTLSNDADGGQVGTAQYDTWKAQYGRRLTNPVNNVTVPEPGAAWLLMANLVTRLLRRLDR